MVMAGENILWVGSEPLRRHSSKPGEGARRVDAALEASVESIRTPGLFATGLHLVGLENADEKRCEEISEALLASGEPVTGEAEKLTKNQEKHLREVFTVKKLTVKTSTRSIASELGVALTGETETLLTERLGHDPGRLIGVLEALAAGGFTTPTGKQVLLLAGTSKEDGMPWHLLDMLENGRDATELLGALEAIPTIAFLAKRTAIALFAAENPDCDLQSAEEVFGEISDGAWRGAKRIATRLGPADTSRLLEHLVIADTWAKRSHPREALVYAAGQTRRLLAGKRSL